MSKKARRNYINSISTVVERKKMYKAKKQWIVAGMSFLVAMGLGAVATNSGVHANADSVQPQIQRPAQNGASIQSKAKAMKANIMAQGAKSAQGQVASSGAQSQSASAVKPASSQAKSSSDTQTLNLGNRSQQARRWNFVQHGIGNSNYDYYKASAKPASVSSAQSSVSSSAPVSKASVASNKVSSSAVKPVSASVKPFGSSLVASKASLKSANPVASSSVKASVSSVGSSALNSSSNQVAKSATKGLGAVAQANSIVSQSQPKAQKPVKSALKLGVGDPSKAKTYRGFTYDIVNSTAVFHGTANNDLSHFYSDAPNDIKNDAGNGLKFANDINLSHVSNMSYMFANDSTNIDFGNNFNTSNVTNMSHMFDGDSFTFTSPSSFNTSKVTDMSYMFNGFNGNINLVNNFDTSHVTNMNHMFSGSNSSINFGNHFNTSNVTDMAHMFEGAKGGTLGGNPVSLQLPQMDVSHVTDMSDMFKSDDAILPSTFDTRNVRNMSDMFHSDNSDVLNSIPSSFNTSNVTNMNSMFSGVSASSIDLSKCNFDTHNVQDMSNMFSSCRSLQSINLGNKFNTGNVTNLGNMFSADYSLQSLNLGDHFDTSNVTNMNSMFGSDSSLQSLNLGNNFVTNKVADASWFANADNKLTSIVLGRKFNLNASKTNTMDMFPSSLRSVTAPSTLVLAYDPYNSANNGLPLKDGYSWYIKGNPKLKVDLFNHNSKRPAYGTYTLQPNPRPQQDTDRVYFITSDAGNLVNPTPLLAKGSDNSDYTVKSNQIPQGYKLNPSSNATFKLDDGDHAITVQNATPDNDEQHIPVDAKTVTFKGTIALDFHNGSQSLKTIYLPYSINTKVNQNVQDILKSTNPSAVVPTDYLNKIIDNYNTANFSYDNNQNGNTYDGVYVDPTNTGDYDPAKNTYNNGTLKLSFSGNKVQEHISYNYKDGKGTNHPEGTYTPSDNNDASGNITDKNAQGLKPGYHLASDNNPFTYGNGGSDANGKVNDNKTINVLPDSATAKIRYQVQNNASDAKENQIIGTHTFTGDDYRTNSDSKDGYVDVSKKTDGMPAGYHLVPNQSTNVPFNNGTDTFKIAPNQVSGDVTVKIMKNDGQGNSFLYRTVKVHESGLVDNGYTVNPSDKDSTGKSFIPNGYVVDGNDNALNGKFVPSGISNNQVTFTYDANKGQQVVVNYTNQHGKIISTKTITGNVDNTGNVISQQGIPAGYHFDNASDKDTSTGKSSAIQGATATNIPYKITTDGQQITVHITGNSNVPNGHHAIVPKHPTQPSDNPTNPTQPSDVNPSHKNSPLDPQDANDTFYVTVNDYNGKGNKPSDLVRSYQKRMTINGDTGDSYTVDPSTFITDGYNDNNMGDNKVTGMIKPDGSLSINTATFNYQANPASTHVEFHYTDNNGTPHVIDGGVINGHADDNVLPSAPKGFHYANKNQKPMHMHAGDNGTDDIDIQGNAIKGTATITLDYDDKASGNVDSTKNVTVAVNGHVGDSAMVVDPFNYMQVGYGIGTISNNSSDTTISNTDNGFQELVIPFDSKIAPNGDNDNYDPSATFTYQGAESGELDVEYWDVDKGAVKNPVGTQKIQNIGKEGQTVYLSNVGSGIKNSNGHSVLDDLQVPTGYTLVHNVNPILIQLHHGAMKLVLRLTSVRPVIPDFPNKPAKANYGQITVNYLDSNNNILDSIATAGKDGTSFNKQGYADVSIPDYHVANVVNGDIQYGATPQSVTVVEAKDAPVAPTTNTKTNTVYVPKIVDVPTSTTKVLQPIIHNYTNDTTNNNSEVNELEAQVAKDNQELANDQNEINQLANKKVAPKVTKKIVKINNDRQLINMKAGHIVKYGHNLVLRLHNSSHYRYFKVYRTIMLHSTFNSVGTIFHIKGHMSPRMLKTVYIKGIYVVRHGKKLTVRYLIRHHGKNLFVTANPRYTKNSYLDAHKSYRGVRFVVNRRVEEREHVNGKAVRSLHKGQVLTIKRIANISRHKRNMMTRIQLSNGLWVTANLNFISLVK